MRALIFGHAGIRGGLENTLPAFGRALRYADGIEFDVRTTGDGKLVTHHDPGFHANGNFQRLREMSLAELRRLHPNGGIIPQVDYVFRAFPNALFNADVKEVETVDALLNAAGRYKAIERTVFSSERPEIIEGLLRECPDCRVGFSIVGYRSLSWIPRLKGLYSLHVPIDGLSYVGYGAFTTLLRAFRKRDLKIYLWNHAMDELRWVPRLLPFVDAVISDDPARLRKVFTGLGGKVLG
ncbi:glycerophosphodiester phosphodiesterase family protein [Palaeococcus ferrophilus]|uniref:glycerophosphodiester phosphodiesterase family protein n=1 Tax=Palaeococcus ferrophilus TaxID=83868 RepID=UPI00064F9856|nr:glycerophosphodiester phosphodiesterase family protein [Palaeococcus ferrophilus]